LVRARTSQQHSAIGCRDRSTTSLRALACH